MIDLDKIISITSEEQLMLAYDEDQIVETPFAGTGSSNSFDFDLRYLSTGYQPMVLGFYQDPDGYNFIGIQFGLTVVGTPAHPYTGLISGSFSQYTVAVGDNTASSVFNVPVKTFVFVNIEGSTEDVD